MCIRRTCAVVRPCVVVFGFRMRCFAPLQGYRSRSASSNGRRSVVFNVREGFIDLPVSIPCGQCVGCRLERSRQWAVRCVHEASLHERNCFLTLTLSDAHLPADGSLDKRVFQLFMKRLRKRFPHDKIRYFHCGEYGDQFGRPHYHCCVFGFDFPDKEVWTTRKGFTVWRSPALEELWTLGNSEIGSVTFESAAYVARYIMKKITGPNADAYYEGRLPEYTTMSRRPGIGAEWFKQFGKEVYPADSVIMRGREMKPPRFYDDLYELQDRDGALEVARKRRAKRRLEDETPERLEVIEQCVAARLTRLERSVD